MAQNVVGQWAADKLDRLGKYLSAYTTIMKSQSAWCDGYHYIDVFADECTSPHVRQTQQA